MDPNVSVGSHLARKVEVQMSVLLFAGPPNSWVTDTPNFHLFIRFPPLDRPRDQLIWWYLPTKSMGKLVDWFHIVFST